MAKLRQADLKRRVGMALREYDFSTLLFRNLVAARLGVNVTDIECLSLLFHRGLASPSELARHTGLSSGATTAMLDRLERSGLIARRPNPDDRRGTLIAIVPSGAEKVDPWFAPVRKAQAALVAKYSDAELQLLADFFAQLAALWEEERRTLER